MEGIGADHTTNDILTTMNWNATIGRVVMTRPGAALMLALSVMSTFPAFGQSEGARTISDPSLSAANPERVLLSLKGGIVLTSPRQVFPSIRVGESTKGTGTISSRDRGESGAGSRVGLELMVPVGERLGIVADVANLVWSARFMAAPSTLPVKLDVQSLAVGLGLQGNVYLNRESFSRGDGLRSVYVGGKLDVGVVTFNNRIEAYAYPDSSGAPVRAVGSFENSDPFRNLTSLVVQTGARYGFGHLEFSGEASYAFALNSLFSSLVVVDNEFTVDNLMLQVGIGYRW